MDFTHDQAIAFQTAKGLGEHFLRDAADGPAQFSVALRSVRQNLDDERGPFVGDSIKDNARRALRFQDRRRCSFHPASLGLIAPDASGE